MSLPIPRLCLAYFKLGKWKAEDGGWEASRNAIWHHFQKWWRRRKKILPKWNMITELDWTCTPLPFGNKPILSLCQEGHRYFSHASPRVVALSPFKKWGRNNKSSLFNVGWAKYFNGRLQTQGSKEKILFSSKPHDSPWAQQETIRLKKVGKKNKHSK